MEAFSSRSTLRCFTLYLSTSLLRGDALSVHGLGWQPTYVYGAPGCKLCMLQVAFARPACLFIARNILNATSSPVHVNIWRYGALQRGKFAIAPREYGVHYRSKLWPSEIQVPYTFNEIVNVFLQEFFIHSRSL